MIVSLYFSSRKIPERCENSFVDYGINYENCYDRNKLTQCSLHWWRVGLFSVRWVGVFAGG